MKKSKIKTIIALFSAFCVCLPYFVSADIQDNKTVRIYNSFLGYADTAQTGNLPNGVSIRSAYRKTRLSGYRDGSPRYGDVMRIGYLAEPIIPFGKLINSNKLHISFDIKATDTDVRNIYIGFYDGRNNEDPNDFGLEQYSMAMQMERGKVAVFQTDSQATNGYDMLSWTRNYTAGVTYLANQWYSVDYEFDFEKKTASFYFDGKLLNQTPIGTAATKGLKGLLFRCEIPKTDSDGYADIDGAFLIDNVSIDEYTDTYEMGNLTEPSVTPDSHDVYISCADEIDEVTKGDISVKTADGEDVDFNIKASDKRGFLLNIPSLIPKMKYLIDMSRIKGTKFGANGRSNIALNVLGDSEMYFFDSFDSYNNETFTESWTPSISGGAELSGDEGYNRFAKISSAESGTKSSIEHAFAKTVTEDSFIVETSVMASGAFDVGFVDTSGNSFNVLGVKVNGLIGCYTASGTVSGTSGGRVSTPYNDLKLNDFNSEFKRIKFLVDKKNKTFKVTTASASYDFAFNYTLNDICGIVITAQNAMGAAVCIDDVCVKKSDIDGAYADFAEDKISYGAAFISSGINSIYGRVLNCSNSDGTTNGVEYYNIEKSKGTMVITTDADSGIDCDENKNIRFEIEYTDSGYGWFYAEYNTADGIKKTSSVCMVDSGEVKKETFTINKWTKNTNGEYVVTIKTYTTVNDGRVSSSNRNYSKYPVIIRKIAITNTDTFAKIEPSITTENSGNIFFEGETPKFDISFKNNTSERQNADCNVYVYKKDKENNDSLIYSTRINADTDGESTRNSKIVIPIEEFGLYKLKTEVIGNGIQSEAVAEFSKCAAVSTQNYTMGTSAHFTRYGDARTGAELLKKAGMGLVRDDFTWNEYERKKGVYALTERQEKLCDAAVEYDLKLLPIVYGNNTLYDSTGSEFISDSAMPDYLNFVKNILSEEKMMSATDMVELWNEPDIKKTKDGAYIERYVDRGKIYGDILRESAKTVRGIDHNYKIGAFCLSNLISTDARSFMDMALSKLTGGNYFDTIALHPYMAPANDPEKGKLGVDTTEPTDYIGYRINYIKALAEGGSVYNHVTGEYDYPKGLITNNQYSFNISEPMWHTEYGISTAKYDKDGLCVGDEYSQAIWLVRGFNQIKLNNFDDMVWFYDFADDGDRINEKEHNFGILHSYTNDVPYSAKYAYLALAAFNKMTEGSESASEVLNTKHSYIARYHSADRDSYLLWTSQTTDQTIEYDFGENVTFYDLIGNEIDKSSVMQDGKYKVSGEPYWAVVGAPIEFCSSDKNKSGLYFVKDGIGTDEDEHNSDTAFDILVDLSGTLGGDRVLVAASYKDDRLVEIKLYPINDGASFRIFNDIVFSDKTNKVKFMLCESMSAVKPLCIPLEKIMIRSDRVKVPFTLSLRRN